MNTIRKNILGPNTNYVDKLAKLHIPVTLGMLYTETERICFSLLFDAGIFDTL